VVDTTKGGMLFKIKTLAIKSKGIDMTNIEDSKENFDTCMKGNCNECPSFPGEKGEGLYCAKGASKASVEKRGCNCPECPVWINNGLSGMYYCIKGKAE